MHDINTQLMYVLNNGENPEKEFIENYLALKIKLGYYEIFSGQEDISDLITRFATKTLRSFGNGLLNVSGKTFSVIRSITGKSFTNYEKSLNTWKNKVLKNSRLIDGKKFDDYKIKIVPYKVLKDRINAVLTIHQVLENIKGIVNSPVAKDNYWITSECQKAIDAMSKIGYNSTSYNMMDDSVSNKYSKASIKQPIFLHKYTLNNIAGLFNYVSKIAKYADPSYIQEYENKFNDCTYTLDEKEADIDLKEAEDVDDKKSKKIAEDKYELSMRASRMWWIIHFIKAAYTVTNDILRDMEELTKVSEKCIAKKI